MKKKIFILLGLFIIIFSTLIFTFNKVHEDSPVKEIKTIEVKEESAIDNKEISNTKDFTLFYFTKYDKDARLTFFKDLKDVDKIKKEPETKPYIFMFDEQLKNNKIISIDID